MDYEKKYKEALERAKELAIDGYLDAVAVSDIFPELAESEDERIRKWCISFIKATCDYDSPTSRKEVDDALAWLEKQREQKIIPKFRTGDYVKNVNDKREPIYEIVYMDKECYVCEYRGKENMGDKAVMHFAFDYPYLRHIQKSAEKVEPKFKIGDKIQYLKG